MTKRIAKLLIAGVAVVAAASIGLRCLVYRSRPQTNEEWRAERAERSRTEWKAELRREMKEAIASATNPKERKLYEYESRMFEHAEKTGEIVSLLQLSDGVDDFEALLIAKVYFSWQFGLCGFVALPEREGDDWVVRISAGREPKSEPSIMIDSRSGAIRCAGHPSISDVVGFVRDPEHPNQAPEPTAPTGRGSSER